MGPFLCFSVGFDAKLCSSNQVSWRKEAGAKTLVDQKNRGNQFG